MRQDLYRAAGFYSSSYLKMEVDTNDSFLFFDARLSELGAATFLHEYIHFLQDISTTHGMFNLISEVDYIKLFNSKLQLEGVTTINVPIQTTIEDGPTHLNLEMRKIWIGGGEHRTYEGEYSVYKEPYNQPRGEGFDPLPLNRIYIQWGNQEIGGGRYAFGSYCISESMAYEIEQVLYRDVIQPAPPQMPYLSARLVVDKIHPGFSDNVENLVALCDASFMYNDPGVVFYDIIKRMEGEKYIPESPEDIYNYVYENTNFAFEHIINPLELFMYAGHLANMQLNDYFRSNIYGQNSIWIARTLSAALNFRIQMPSFILDIMRDGDIRQSVLFNALKLRLGTPLIVNNQDEVFFEHILNGFGYNILPQYFWVFKEIKDLISEQWINRKSPNLCDLKRFCDKSCEDQGVATYTDIRCRNNPWERSNDPNPELCYFGATWKSWALQGKEIEQID